MAYCSSCGEKLIEGANFCHNCGEPVGDAANNQVRRQQEYVGKILKCPNCGGVVTQLDAVCPNCGTQITGKSATASVQEFKEQLMEIESTRKKGTGGMFGVYASIDPADQKKLSLIKNFPIPNSVDEISEFMMLAIANIDVSLSKNTVMNKWNNSAQSVETRATIGRIISNAWVSKMKQAYQKALITFHNDPAFKIVQQMYFEEMKELKMKIE